MHNLLNILHLEDDRLDGDLIRETLASQGTVAEMQLVQTEAAFRAALLSGDVDLVLSDYYLPGFNGLSALRIVREMNPDLPFIFVSGTTGEEIAIESLKSGATDYVLKQRLQGLGLSVQRALREVEERKRSRRKDEALVEKVRQSSEFRYRRLFESAKDGILILDADNGQIVDVNPYLIELLGFTKEELVGKELWEIGPFKDIVASKIAFAELQRRGYIRYENLPLETREGLVRQVEFVSNSYLAGESRVILCNIRDITERKLAEVRAFAELQTKTHELATMTQQLWQASKLATLGELAASVAHELNNPLTTLALHAESLLDRLSVDDPKRHAVEVIAQEVERMATLVSNLLLFSRRGQPQISNVNLVEELSNSLEFINYHLRSHNINVVTNFPSDLPGVHADRQQLRQVFLNLMANGGDAMADGGTLTVRAKRQTLASGAPAVMIEFADTGVGIEPEDMARLWEPFFTTKPEGRGTGLGLPICRRTVEEHRGTIDIESQPGIGTTVRIIWPAVMGAVIA
jgi:PAS domain S-box-containing protein